MTAALWGNRNREEKFCSVTSQATPPRRGGNLQTKKELHHSKPAASLSASDNTTKTKTQWEKDCTKAMTKQTTHFAHKNNSKQTKKEIKSKGSLYALCKNLSSWKGLCELARGRVENKFKSIRHVVKFKKAK